MSGKTEMTYDKARDELVKITEQLEQGAKSLDDSIKLWEKGNELAKFCKEYLENAKKRLNEPEGKK
jgi:exodeoxyribonuclease VII small subunit